MVEKKRIGIRTASEKPAAKARRSNLADRMAVVSRKVHPIYLPPAGGKSWTDVLMKAALDENAKAKSSQPRSTGRKGHPFNMRQAARFMLSNTHHAAAIMAKRNSTTGLGYLSPLDRALRDNEKRMRLGIPATTPPAESLIKQTRSKVAEILDPLCAISFQDLQDHIGEDLANTHNAYMEVVRRSGDGMTGMPTGLHHIPAHEVYVFVENRMQDRHFEVLNGSSGQTLRFPRFGEKARFMATDWGKGRNPQEVSEVIQIRYPSSMSRDYGIPTWISGVAAIETVQALHQHEFDFYNNRGVPEFLLFLLGKRLDDQEWAAISDVFTAGVGLGNTHKSGAFNIDGGEDLRVQVEKLAMEGKSDGRFSEMSTALALEIVTGHRIPPLLAGITIPGKLGASNELPNALMAYQTLTVAPDQATIQATLGHTLGNKEVNGGLALEFDDFEAKTILDVMDLQRMNTVAGMKQTVPEAKAEGRDLDEGLKKSEERAVDGLLKGKDPAEIIGDVVAVLLERACAAA